MYFMSSQLFAYIYVAQGTCKNKMANVEEPKKEDVLRARIM